MKKVTIKEVIPPRTTKSPIILVTSDGSKISAFAEDGLEGLKEVKAGWVLNVKLQVKGKYTNITAFEVVSQETIEAPKQTPFPDNAYKADPAKLASEELRSRMHAAKDLWAAGKLQDGDPEVKLLRSWIMGHEAPQPSPEPPQPASKKKADVTTGKEKLLDAVCVAKSFKTPKTARTWLENVCKIEPDRIDTEPDKVLEEVKPYF